MAKGIFLSFAKILNVNEMTIRRDLKTLENQNLLIRTPKGARNMPTRFMGYYHDQEIQESLKIKTKYRSIHRTQYFPKK